MKTCLIFLCVFFQFCSNSNKPPNVALEKRTSLKNDTLCIDMEMKEFVNFRFVKYCHIVYNDSFARIRHSEYGNDKLPDNYNFEDQLMLKTIKQGDSFFVKIIYLSKIWGKDLIPDTIFLRGDTLFVRERGVDRGDKSYRMGEASEVVYCFLLKNNKQMPYIRHLFFE